MDPLLTWVDLLWPPLPWQARVSTIETECELVKGGAEEAKAHVAKAKTRLQGKPATHRTPLAHEVEVPSYVWASRTVTTCFAPKPDPQPHL